MNKTAFYNAPPRWEALCRELDALKKLDGVRVFRVGKSNLGREIRAVGLGRMDRPALMVGGVHSLEWLTTLVLTRFCRELAEAAAENMTLDGIAIRPALAEKGLVILPQLNPDGTELVLGGPETAGRYREELMELTGGDFSGWQANIRGVDLNHNFDAGFAILQRMEREAGITGPSPRRYGGPFPESEPETAALCRLCRKICFRHVIAFHSQGEEIYWRYGPVDPPHSRTIAELLARSSGYALLSPEGMASHGGFKDWFISKIGRPGFTVEMGRGENPLPIGELDPIYARLFEMLLVNLLV
ncbi:MAG: gamma-D-glutamyl-meso-diaminopimelate peptidase [Ruminococcaceae bacterium]|nr:gamma-D-glutamyl-meso-diaminopimelate peptidase [Oscillospiraceae bacterium]